MCGAALTPSKLNCLIKVPRTAPALTTIRAAESLYAAGAQTTAVAVVHAVLRHGSTVVSDAVGVTAASPKPKPVIVTEPPVVTPALAGPVALTHGAAT